MFYKYYRQPKELKAIALILAAEDCNCPLLSAIVYFQAICISGTASDLSIQVILPTSSDKRSGKLDLKEAKPLIKRFSN